MEQAWNMIVWLPVQDLEAHLSKKHKGEWLAGPQMTAADIMLSYTLGLMTYSHTGPQTPAPKVRTSVILMQITSH